jgi:hypothetical protein
MASITTVMDISTVTTRTVTPYVARLHFVEMENVMVMKHAVPVKQIVVLAHLQAVTTMAYAMQGKTAIAVLIVKVYKAEHAKHASKAGVMANVTRKKKTLIVRTVHQAYVAA